MEENNKIDEEKGAVAIAFMLSVLNFNKLPCKPMSTTITKLSKILISFDFYVKPFPLLIFLPFKNSTLDAQKGEVGIFTQNDTELCLYVRF